MKRVILTLLVLAAMMLGAKDRDPKAIVGKIDEKTYTYGEYDKILARYFDYHKSKAGKPLTDQDKAGLNNRCWEELVGRYIYDKAIKNGKVKVTQQELLREAKKNPSPAVKKIPDLQTKGRFDQKLYEKALTENKEFRESVLAEVRELYQYSKLLDTVRSEATVVEDSVKAQWEHDNELVDAKIIFFDANRLVSVVSSEDEAITYFNARLEEYRKDDCRRYRYVKIPKTPSREDSLAVYERVMQIYRDLKAGADFAEIARAQSQDPGSAAKGGDLGWFGRGRMVPVFEEAAFNTPVGGISEPVRSSYGWHIIKTQDRREVDGREEVSASHILIMIQASATTQQLMKTQTSKLFELAKQNGLVTAAGELGMKLEETGVFQAKDAMVPGVGRDAGLVKFAFDNPEGTLAEIYNAPSGDAFVCEISGVYPVYYPSFEEVRSRVMNQATASKRGFQMQETVQNFVREIKPEQYLEAAARDSILVVEVTAHKKGDKISSIGMDPALEEALFNTPEGSFAPLISQPLRWFLVQVDKHQLPDPAVWVKDKTKLMEDARKKAESEYLNNWYRGEREKLNIIDNRKEFYDLGSAGRTIQL